MAIQGLDLLLCLHTTVNCGFKYNWQRAVVLLQEFNHQNIFCNNVESCLRLQKKNGFATFLFKKGIKSKHKELKQIIEVGLLDIYTLWPI